METTIEKTAEQTVVTGDISQPAFREHIVFALGPGGEVEFVERIDTTGVRKTLSDDECAALAGAPASEEIIAALDAGYEAGILDGVGDDDLLERLLLFRLITGATGRNMRALRRATLRRILLRRLLGRRASYNANGGVE